MHISIDQSPRVEDWNDDSVIAYANSKEKAIILTSSLKREARALLEERGKDRDTTKWILLAAAIFTLLSEDLNRLTSVTIDLEFDSKTMKQIRSWIYSKAVTESNKRGISLSFTQDDIHLLSVGRKHRSHTLAYGIYRRKIVPDEDIRVKRRDFLTLL